MATRNSPLWLALPAVVFLAAAFAWPVLRLLSESLAGGEGGRSPLVEVLVEAPYRRALLGSVALSLGVAVASVLLCLPAALTLSRVRFRGKGLLRAAIAVPLSLSGVVIGFLAVAMIGSAGFVPQVTGGLMKGAAYGLGGLCLAYLYFEIPRATLTLESALAAVDGGLLDAARTLGARPAHVVARVVLPLAAPAVRAAFSVTFAASLGSFGVALILAARVPILPVEMYRAFTGLLDDGLASAMAVWLGAGGLLVLVAVAPRRTP